MWRKRFASVAILCFLVASAACWSSTSAFGLERTYEMVSPPFKAGYGVSLISAVAPDGESVAFGSQGIFAGAPSGSTLEGGYVARREASAEQWSTVPVVPPDIMLPFYQGRDFSSSLDSNITLGVRGRNEQAGSGEGTENVFLYHRLSDPDLEEYFSVAGMVLEALDHEPEKLTYAGASPDFSHIMVSGANNLLEETVGTGSTLYDLKTVGAGAPSLSLVGANNKLGVHNQPEVLKSDCTVSLGAGTSAGASYVPGSLTNEYNAVADDGKMIFFTTCIEKQGAPYQLFVRLEGERTLEISRPLNVGEPFGGCIGLAAPHIAGEVPCEGANTRGNADFVGASRDGSRVFFTTPAKLVGEDEDAGQDLYMATIGCPAGEPQCEVSSEEVTSLTRLSNDSIASEAANVQGVLKISPDGTHVYFVARGILTGEANSQQELPLSHAENLYVYERDKQYPGGHVQFIADLCSGPGLSGEVEDISCPLQVSEGDHANNDTTLWGAAREVQTNECYAPSAEECTGAREPGRFLVFASYGQLVKGDTDTVKDIYRYDSVTGALVRVSIGEDGHDANGNANGPLNNATVALNGTNKLHVDEQFEMASRAISEDGSQIVFGTAGQLSQRAINALTNFYLWQEGKGSGEGSVSIVSSGTAGVADRGVVIAPSGGDVFFLTTQGLVPQDTDGQVDIYDARVGGGFPEVAAEREPCSGDGCQGPLTNPAPLLVPGSVSQAPGENFSAPVKVTAKATKGSSPPKQKAKAKKKKSQAHLTQPKSRRSRLSRGKFASGKGEGR